MRNRVEMVRLAIEHIPYFKLDLSEADTTKHSYTYQTMKEFNRLYPDVDFYFILGADSLFSIEEWRFFREIFTTCTILAAMRDAWTDPVSETDLWSKYRTASCPTGRGFLNYNPKKGF